MRIANLRDRLVLVTTVNAAAGSAVNAAAGAAGDAAGFAAVDVERASGGRFGPDPQAIYDEWDAFIGWAPTADLQDAVPFALAELGAPVPRPRQVLAIGLNYSQHAAESGFQVPDAPTVLFTKWVSCLTGPVTDVVLPAGGHTDWEIELVAVIGRAARDVSVADGWDHVAGLTAGQDLSERIGQMAGPSPQFSLAKSLPGFGPTGPWLVTPDELDDRDDLELGCSINGEQMQEGRTRDLIFSVPALIAALSQQIPLLPGDILFTGTPAGVGIGRTPPRWLVPGDELTSYICGIGELRQRFVAAP